MRLEFRMTTMAAVAALCVPVAAHGQKVVEGMSQRLTVACGAEGIHVQGMGNTVTLTGPCATVKVEGSNNTVHIASLGRLTLAGMNNKVYWTAGIDGAAPKITKEGFGNTVEKKAPADAEPPARSQTVAPSGGSGSGTARATASSGSSSASATAKPGNPTLAVGSGSKKVSMGAGAGGAGVSASKGEPAPARPASSTARRSSSSSGSSAASAPPTGVGTPILVPINQQVKTMECEGRAVSIQGNGNRLTLKGTCGPITIGGNDNILDVGATTWIDTSGNRNVVKYRELVNDKAPRITSGGTGNRVSRAEPQ